MFDNFYKNKSFLFAFAIVFLGLILTKIGIRVPNIISPITNAVEKNQKNTFFEIKKKLENKKNYFKLYKNTEPFYYNISAENASSYLVADLDTGNILAEKNSEKPLPIASLTKVMTAVVALDLALPSDVFQVSETASRIIPTKIGVEPGEKMTLNELLNATLLTSANDAAQVIKEGVDQKYGEKVFIKAMNEKAKFLGLKNSSFANPQGFDDPNNYSSTQDLATLTHYAINNYPLIKEIVKKDYEYLPASQNHKKYDLYNWNGLIGVYPNVFGVKIGNTDKAETTTIVVSEREGKDIIAVLLGAPDVLQRDLWAGELLDLGFEKAMNLPPVLVNENQLQAKYNTWQYWN